MLNSSNAGGIHGLRHEGEDIKVVVTPIAEALALLEAGRIVNAKTVVALQWLALNRDRVERRWGSPRAGG